MFKSERESLIEAVIKAVVTVVLVAVVAYSVVMEVPISTQVMRLVFLVLAAYFGFGATLSGSTWGRIKRSRRFHDG